MGTPCYQSLPTLDRTLGIRIEDSLLATRLVGGMQIACTCIRQRNAAEILEKRDPVAEANAAVQAEDFRPMIFVEPGRPKGFFMRFLACYPNRFPKGGPKEIHGYGGDVSFEGCSGYLAKAKSFVEAYNVALTQRAYLQGIDLCGS